MSIGSAPAASRQDSVHAQRAFFLGRTRCLRHQIADELLHAMTRRSGMLPVELWFEGTAATARGCQDFRPELRRRSGEFVKRIGEKAVE
jgi:hypothetical protein